MRLAVSLLWIVGSHVAVEVAAAVNAEWDDFGETFNGDISLPYPDKLADEFADEIFYVGDGSYPEEEDDEESSDLSWMIGMVDNADRGVTRKLVDADFVENPACIPSNGDCNDAAPAIVPGTPVIIPCGQCVTVDSSWPSEVIIDGLDIRGKLVIDSSAKINVTTPFVYVQGVMEILSTSVASPSNEIVRFILTGNTGLNFLPDQNGPNKDSCGTGGCAVGIKPFLIAGGKVNIRALPDNCTTWSKLKGVSRSSHNTLAAGSFLTMISPGEGCLSDPCKELILNGDIEGNGNSPFPFGKSGGTLSVVEEGGNKFLRLSERSSDSTSIEQKLSAGNGCLTRNLEYVMSLSVRVTDGTNVASYVEIETKPFDGNTFYTRVLDCPEQNENQGWVTCTGSFLIPESLEVDAWHAFRFRTSGGWNGDIDIDNVSFLAAEGPVDGLIVDDVSDCWGIGSEIHITSHTLDEKDGQVAIIKNISSQGDGTALVNLEGSIVPPFSEQDDPDVAVEVGLLTRNVIIEGDTDATYGGYSSFFHTPDLVQHLEGVEFRNMGEPGVDNRYPIHFRLCGDVAGSMVSKNTIRDSHQRCVVLEGTDNVHVYGNVAYNNIGHCYMIHDGGEQGNVFEQNLGSQTLRSSVEISDESDDDPYTFYSKTPNNHWIGNCAAGSAEGGFKFSLSSSVRGDSKPLHSGVNPRKVPFGTFKDNIAHSNGDYGAFLYYWEHTDVVSIFENNKFFRNKGHGVFTRYSRNMEFKDGMFADNKVAMSFEYCDLITVTDIPIRGMTQLYKSLLATQSVDTLSEARGVRIAVYLRWGLTSNGMKLSNLHFSDFDAPENSNSKTAIVFDEGVRDKHWDYTTSFTNITIIDSRGRFMDMCYPISKGINDIYVTDSDGSFDPSSSETFDGPGVIVSNEPFIVGNMTTFATGECTEYENQCYYYCRDTCYRTVHFLVDRYNAYGPTEDLELHITETDTLDTIVVKGYSYDNSFWNKHYFRYLLKFSASLPQGNYRAQFYNPDGTEAVTVMAEEFWEPAPACSGHADVGDITLLVKDVDVETECVDLIRNTDMESGFVDVDPWYHTGGGVDLKPGDGVGGTNAIWTTNRKKTYHGIGQYLDMRCVKALVGKQFEFQAKVLLVHESTGALESCDPNNDSSSQGCPRLTIRMNEYTDSSKTKIQQKYYTSRAVVVRPYNLTGYTMMSGIIQIDNYMAEKLSIFVYVEKSDDDYEIVLDDAWMRPYSPAESNFQSDMRSLSWCDEFVSNGDFATGDSRYFDHYGSNEVLEIVPGAGGDGDLALKVSERTQSYHGPRQDLKQCFVAGERYIARAKYFLEKGGVFALCDPFTWSSETECPYASIKTYIRDTSDEWLTAAIASGPSNETGWSSIAGTFFAREREVDAEYLRLYFTGEHKDFDFIVDDVSVVPVPKDCNSLVLNSDFEADFADFWETDSRSHSMLKMLSPGAPAFPGEPSSKHALCSYNRDSNNRGIMQTLDHRCFETGKTFEVTAKFRLLLAGTETGVTCDKTVASGSTENCPTVHIIGSKCPNDDDANKRLWNTLPWPWDKDAWNSFKAVFEVDGHMASCERIRVYVKDLNKDWDIVVDDLRIETPLNLPPTKPPTPAPVPITSSPTIEIIPTPSPSAGPTPTSFTSCPVGESGSLSLSGGTVYLNNVGANILCTLTKVINVDNSTEQIIPVARSYDTNDWERSAGEFAATTYEGTDFTCYSSGCRIDLPALAGNEEYRLTSYEYTLSSRDENARLLESATFGATQQELDSWTHPHAGSWVEAQMIIPMTSHREYFRKRATPQWPFPARVGKPDHPCKAGSWWRKYTFTRKDRSRDEKSKYLTTLSLNETSGTGPYVLAVNGQARTIVNELLYRNEPYRSNFNYDVEHEICNYPYAPSDRLPRGILRVRAESDGSCQEIDRLNANPIIDLSGLDQSNEFFKSNIAEPLVLDLTNAVFANASEHLDNYPVKTGELLLMTSTLTDTLCDNLPEVFEEDDQPVFGQLQDGTWVQFDMRLELEENTVASPLADGGGTTHLITGGETLCSNAPRTFLNFDNCVMSSDESACGAQSPPEFDIILNDANILTLHNLTGLYVYAVDGLPVQDVDNYTISHPFSEGRISRWARTPGPCASDTTLAATTNASLYTAITMYADENPYIIDIEFSGGSESEDRQPFVSITVGGECFSHVHPDHLNVYDFTYWTREGTHPGNIVAMMENETNPIKKWADEYNSAKLIYPAIHPEPDSGFDHPMIRWTTHHKKFGYVGRYGDKVSFRDLINEFRVREVAEYFGFDSSVSGKGVMVCGSPFEVANDGSLGSQFDLTNDSDRDTASGSTYRFQREVVWTTVVLSAQDQLRQRMAWALDQIFVVVKSAIETQDRNTEIFLNYYDIMVRHAFGNFRDLLREVSYSPLMAENLSFLKSKSSAYVYEKDGVRTFADENFAREIMQLFTMGLWKLHEDGTPVTDVNGNQIQVYTNEHIESFARIWTGFDTQVKRGNTEDYDNDDDNRLDPMRIDPEWRDRFPKPDLYGGYIGDGVPLCVDLPEQMFLKPGAKYRLLGSSSQPDLMMKDPSEFATDETIIRMRLDETSPLKDELCNADVSGTCNYANSVVLTSALACSGKECKADTVRVVQVDDDVFYEYVELPCVQHVFFDNAMKLSKRRKTDAGTMCGNELLPVASEACCPDPLPSGTLKAIRNQMFDGERMTFAKSVTRCAELGMQPCDYDEVDRDIYPSYKTGYHWAVDPCYIQAKIDSLGEVAVIYYTNEVPHSKVLHVNEDTRNYFGVHWKDGVYPSKENFCAGGLCEEMSDLDGGGCRCNTKIVESVVFHTMPKSKEEVNSKLHMGAVDPNGDASYTATVNAAGDVTAHLIDGNYDLNAIFEVEDQFGRVYFYKNALSTVKMFGVYGAGQATPYSFRNPVHYMSLIPTETDSRVAEYETEAVLDHYFYHENTPQFLAVRLCQRFGFSNPSPRFVKVVATAFREGSYHYGEITFGLGEYGDLAATAAAIVLDREARSVILDADASHGSLREPILKVLSFMRNMDFETQPNYPMVQLEDMEEVLGQMAFEYPSVFSFFLPEYRPFGPVGDALLVAPEGLVLDTPKIVGMCNGLFSMAKYGLADCYSGFGKNDQSGSCKDDGLYDRARGILKYTPPAGGSAMDVVNDLSTLLTAGRLSATNKQILVEAYESETDAAAGLRLVQQLIATTPEFHSTNPTKLSGTARVEEEGEARLNPLPYRATVFLMFGGGCDSYNMLAPHSGCSPPADNGTTDDLRLQYENVRQQIALPLTSGERQALLPISAQNQPCSTFGIHSHLPVLQQLYNDGDAIFFANIGELSAEMTPDNYRDLTQTQLFAHNTMQKAAKKVDPYQIHRNTGVMGRMTDVLTGYGVKTGSISIDESSLALVGHPGESPAINIVSRNGVEELNPDASSDGMPAWMARLNNATKSDSGFFAETWSAQFLQSVKQNEEMYTALETLDTNVTFSDTKLAKKLKTVSKMMRTAGTRKAERDFFYVEIGGFDTHSQVLDNLEDRFDEVNDGIASFVAELKSHGLWDETVLVQTSDFARTLTPNGGDGSDHAWGGQSVMLGGSVKGGQVMGKYVDNIYENGPLMLSRGRVVPTSPWDTIWHGLAPWMGIQLDDLDKVCPNLNSFLPDLYNEADLFHA